MAVESPIEKGQLFIGQDKPIRFTVLDDAGDPMDIAGWTLVWTLRRRADHPEALISKDAQVLDAPGGLCEVVLEDVDTDDIKPGTYWHALWRRDDGNETPLAYGPAVLSA